VSERRAVDAYRAGEASINEAARIADVSVGEWLKTARKEGLTYRLSTDDLEKDVEIAQKL
jgi:predicted HTH domain antitoxin